MGRQAFFLLWVVGLNFYSKLCMVGADFFFFLLVVGLEKKLPPTPPHMVNSGTTHREKALIVYYFKSMNHTMDKFKNKSITNFDILTVTASNGLLSWSVKQSLTCFRFLSFAVTIK